MISFNTENSFIWWVELRHCNRCVAFLQRMLELSPPWFWPPQSSFCAILFGDFETKPSLDFQTCAMCRQVGLSQVQLGILSVEMFSPVDIPDDR